MAKITDGRYRLNIAEASVNDFLALQSNSKLANISIADTSSNVAINLSALAGSSALSAIALSAPSEPMEMSASDYSQYNGTLSKISTGYAVVLSGASVAAAGTLQTDSKVQGMTISDTSAHISSSLAALSAMSKITGFDVTQDNGTIQFSLTQLDTLPDTLSLLNQATGVSHRIEVTGASVNDLDELLARDDVDLVRVNDSSANIASGYDRLYAAMDRISGIQLSDATEPVNLSQQQLLNQPELLQKISGSPALQIYHVSATNASAISNTSGVTGVQVLDTASAISQEFDNLVSLGSKVLEVQVSDDNDILISSAQATDGASLLDRIVGEHSVVIT